MRYGLSESAAPDPSQVAKALEEGLGWLTRALSLAKMLSAPKMARFFSPEHEQ
jgi:hypothetical protein